MYQPVLFEFQFRVHKQITKANKLFIRINENLLLVVNLYLNLSFHPSTKFVRAICSERETERNN